MKLFTGEIKLLLSKSVILDISGIGYLVNISSKISVKPKDMISLYVHEEFKIDKNSKIVQNFYGFITLNEYEFFKFLLNIQGIAEKTAFNILQNDFSELIDLIYSRNNKKLNTFSGITERIANLIFLEIDSLIKNKKNISFLNKTELKIKKSWINEDFLIKSLKNIGFSVIDVEDAISKIKLIKKQYLCEEEVFADCIKIISENKNSIINK